MNFISTLRKMLRIENVNKSYGEIQALKDVNFDVGDGELFGLIGPDGAGKTSLIRIITTLMLADSGKVSMKGHDVVDDMSFVRKNVGYMPGKFSLYQDLSVLENLEFFATIFNTTIEKNRYLIEDIYKQIEPFKHRKAGALSGGMKQKLALCCALIHKPILLLLDEPTTGVDAVSRKEFWQMLQKLREDGISILVSTPYMDESKLCDRVALMQNGNILSIETPQKIVSEFDKNIYDVKGRDLYGLLDKIRSLEKIDQAYPFGESLHVYTKTKEGIEELIRGIRPEENIEVAPITADIEDCFMNLMTKSE